MQMIQSEFPFLTYQKETGSNIKQLFLVIQKLADHTKMQLLDDNEAEIEHCYQVAHEILQQGSNISKLAIENVFVYSVSRLLDISLTVSNNSRKEFLKFFRKEYSRQITTNLP